jgi:protoheme ferro-lyase
MKFYLGLFLATAILGPVCGYGSEKKIGVLFAAYEDMKARFSENLFVVGFQNHSELGSRWTLPDANEQAHWLAAAADCPNVLINGRISFTIDNIETLYDENVHQRAIIAAAKPDAQAVVQKSFNAEPSFVSFLALLVSDALNGVGDIQVLGLVD